MPDQAADSSSPGGATAARRGRSARAIERWLGAPEEIALAGVVAQLEDRLEMVGRLDALRDDAMATVSGERPERPQHRLTGAVGRARADERQVDLEDVVLDLAQQAQAGVAGADVVDRHADLVPAQRRDRLLEPLQVVDALAFGELDDELRRRRRRGGVRARGSPGR